MLRKLCLSLFLSIVSFLLLPAQDVTGIWKGYFITESGEYYKLEFQVLQNGKSAATGVSYSYLDVRFYGKATMTGNFISNSSAFRIREVKTVEVKSSLGGGTCIMNYNLNYSSPTRFHRKYPWPRLRPWCSSAGTTACEPARGR